MAQAGSENFPVASRVLPASVRGHLLALYGFARLVDDAGDEAHGDRLGLLDQLEADLERAFTGTARNPLLVALQPTLAQCSLPIAPFRRLIEANRRDQLVHRYQTFEELLGYCELSANPVGELVLGIFGAATPERIALSNRVCSGLQLVEHWQDIAEDFGRGRVYLPAEDRDRFGVSIQEARFALGQSRLQTAARLRGRAGVRPARPRRAADPHASGPSRVSCGRLCRRRARSARGDRASGLRCARLAPPPGTGARRARAGGNAAAPERALMATHAPIATPEEGYRACEAITRARAANFYYGIRLLPAPKRRAMCAVYAFARRVDDIGDGTEPDARKLELLNATREEIEAPPEGPVAIALRDAERRFELPHAALLELIAGVEMDVRGESYEDFDQLVTYCRRVAGTIGRLSVAIFGARDRQLADALADDLGVAMQLTNILRDVREDHDRGRVYLPRADLERFGCEDLLGAPSDAFGRLIAFEAARARQWFERGLRLLDLIDGRSGACVGAMTGIYRRILERIERDPETVRERRVSLPPWEKTWVAIRSLKEVAGTAS